MKKKIFTTKTGRLTKEGVIHALEKTRGKVAAAARELGCSRQSIYNRLDEYPEIAISRKDAQEALVEQAEDALSQLVAEGDGPSIRYVLDTQGRHHGFVKPVQIGGIDGKPLEIKTKVSLAERLKEIRQAGSPEERDTRKASLADRLKEKTGSEHTH